MFSRDDHRKKLLVEIVCIDGSVLRGNLVIAATSDLVRTINNDVRFLHFEAIDGETRFVAKDAVAQIVPREVPKAVSLNPRDDVSLDPYALLGLKPDATLSEARTAYIRMTKRYHPDQFSSVQLPDEVSRYLSSMLARSNSAYTMIRAQLEDGAPKPRTAEVG